MSSFRLVLLARGISGGERRALIAVVDELVGELGHTDLQRLTLEDLERFYRERAPGLSAPEARQYGRSMAVLAELLPSLRSSVWEERRAPRLLSEAQTDPSTTAHPRFEPVSTTVYGSFGNDTGGFAEAQSTPSSGRARVRTDTAVRVPSSRVEPIVRNGDDSSASWIHEPAEQLEERPVEDSGIDLHFDRTDRFVALRWRGFVVGWEIRAAVERAMSLTQRYDSARWMADMRRARVMNTQDAQWFAQWLREASGRGVQRLAVVTPENAVTKLQLVRLREGLGKPDGSNGAKEGAGIVFFDDEDDARGWLRRNRSTVAC